MAGFGVPSDVVSPVTSGSGGNKVLMVSGTDEHGTPILVQAEKEGRPPSRRPTSTTIIATDLTNPGLSYDLFTRTTTGNHEKVGRRCAPPVPSRTATSTRASRKSPSAPPQGAHCRTVTSRALALSAAGDGARGDQCDNCGNELDPTDLINPRSKINGETPVFKETEHYFLDLPALAKANLAWLDTRTDWRTNVINFSKGLFKEVKPRAITRDIDWGIPVPVDGWVDNPNKRLYVWFDAVIGYLSASIEWARRFSTADEWRKWWNDPSSPAYYFMGKDNITFHSQIWPSEILAYNGEGSKGGEPGSLGRLNLPEQVVASAFMTMEGKQFSSSRGIVIYVRDILSRYSADAVRYYISIAGPESQDADFRWAEFVRHNNEELVSGWGNLVNRVATLLHKNFGSIPAVGKDGLEKIDSDLLSEVEKGFETVGHDLETQHQHAALGEAMRLAGETNKYISDTEPWKIADKDRLATVLHTAAQAVLDLDLLLAPFLPSSSQKVWETLGQKGTVAPLPRLERVDDLDKKGFGYPIITGDYELGKTVAPWAPAKMAEGAEVPKPHPLFAKIPPEAVKEEVERSRRQIKGRQEAEKERLAKAEAALAAQKKAKAGTDGDAAPDGGQAKEGGEA